MIQEISEYTLINKRLTGQTLKLFFSRGSITSRDMVLELINIAVFIDNYNLSETETLFLDIDQAGSYGADMAMRLKRPEIIKFQEVFLSGDSKHVTTKFRGIAEKINWRKFDGDTYGDVNY